MMVGASKRAAALQQLLLLLLATAGPAARGACSSLDGPYCPDVNGREPPRYSHGAADGMASQGAATSRGLDAGADLLDTLLDAIAQSITEGAAALGALGTAEAATPTQKGGKLGGGAAAGGGPYAEGSFGLTGSYDPWRRAEAEDLPLAMSPTRWNAKPGPDWVMVGFDGQISRSKAKGSEQPSFTLQAMLVDEELQELEGCTELVAKRRTRPGERLAQAPKWADVLSDSTWEGTYSCAGLETKMVLKLRRSEEPGKMKRLPAGELRGDFSFVVKRRAQRRAGADAQGGLAALHDLLTGNNVRLTEAGCQCATAWEQDIEGPDGVVKTYAFEDGNCGNPAKARKRDYCVIEPTTCQGQPAALLWDYCKPNWRQIKAQALKLREFKLDFRDGEAVFEETTRSNDAEGETWEDAMQALVGADAQKLQRELAQAFAALSGEEEPARRPKKAGPTRQQPEQQPELPEPEQQSKSQPEPQPRAATQPKNGDDDQDDDERS